MTETEHLRQQIAHLAARIGAMEHFVRALFVIVAQRDKTPIKTIEEQIVPSILAQCENRPRNPANPPELDQWLHKKELELLTAELRKALEALYAASGAVSSSPH